MNETIVELLVAYLPICHMEFIVLGCHLVKSYALQVWDISHYLIRCRSCSDEEHAERQDVWDRFPMMKWLRHLEEICMIHLDFRCMKTAHERDTPHLLNSFRGHVRVINSIDHFQNKYGRWGDNRDCDGSNKKHVTFSVDPGGVQLPIPILVQQVR